MAPLSPEAFADLADVSRETMRRLGAYLDLLRKWQAATNLVGRSTLEDPWRRHMLDSAQLWPLIRDPAGPLVDLGSGAGFPGLVLAAMGAADVHLYDGDARKCAFLREAARVLGLAATIHCTRIESAKAFPAATVTARALAPLDRLFALAAPFFGPGTVGLFLKGRMVNKELTRAAKNWTMRLERIPSVADANGVCLRVEEVALDGAHRRAP